MEIKTINNQVINTDKLSDIRAELTELVENCGIYEFSKKHDGLCYVLLSVPNQPAHSKMHLNNQSKVDYFLKCVNEIFMKIYNNKLTLAVVDNKPIKQIIYEE